MPFLPKWTNEPSYVDLEENVALGTGMSIRYEDGDCGIVISIKNLSNDVLKMLLVTFFQKSQLAKGHGFGGT